MRCHRLLVLLIITCLLLGIISFSSVTALELKTSKSPATQVIKKDVGTKLFDGREIIQSPTVISKALKQFESVTDSGDEEAATDSQPSDEEVFYWIWNLSQFADYLASNTSNTLLYSLVRTDGDYFTSSHGVLGYSPHNREIIGDKQDVYRLSYGVSGVPDHEFMGYPYQWRVIIMPDDNKLIIQNYDSDSSSPTPIFEDEYPLSAIATSYGSSNGKTTSFYGARDYGVPVTTLAIWPYPIPTSAP
ncbi:hypothetical protein ACKUB1_01045 [Methanospirillum stamsii]|uniref:Uncharacterized protein n=1 Tax=Methanospirillum stamsii TaxID=1277351 RepID=A0A2V2N357_9EURY|nr:hypothetical protein [Methanospirillum stamsii]PWR74582.1 hypothetical protein DLD82_08335 [Methanospirillum stamsii]